MLQNLMTVSDMQLAVMQNRIEERGKKMMTEAGRKEAQLWTLQLITRIASCGYKLPDIDKKMMALSYEEVLKEAIVTYGCNDIWLAVREWIKNDTRQYKAFPTAGDILDAVKSMLGNPAAEIARREHEHEVERIVAREHEELMKDVTPEQMEKLERKYKHEN